MDVPNHMHAPATRKIENPVMCRFFLLMPCSHLMSGWFPDDVVMALFATISAPSEQCVLWLPEKNVVAFCYS